MNIKLSRNSIFIFFKIRPSLSESIMSPEVFIPLFEKYGLGVSQNGLLLFPTDKEFRNLFFTFLLKKFKTIDFFVIKIDVFSRLARNTF